jgi:hypothetical protein
MASVLQSTDFTNLHELILNGTVHDYFFAMTQLV